ncbi:MAG: response regulator transcription factor [Candidatus Competibacteraceae bacterium]
MDGKPSASRILIVEDEAVTRARLQTLLAQNPAYVVVSVASIKAAQEALQNQDFDIVLLDIHLPDADSFSFASEIGDRIDMGLIVTSAFDDDRSRLQTLRCGADAYLSKPYNSEELVLKIARLAKRISVIKARTASVPQRLRFGPWTYDPEAMTLYRKDGKMIKLSSHEKRLLALFLEYPGRVFSRQKLLDALHPDNVADVFDRAVDSAIARLRRRIENDPKAPKILKTVYGEGYVFDTPVRQLRVVI